MSEDTVMLGSLCCMRGADYNIGENEAKRKNIAKTEVK